MIGMNAPAIRRSYVFEILTVVLEEDISELKTARMWAW